MSDELTRPGRNGGTLRNFQKGVGGNPTGMPKITGELQKAARLMTMEALNTAAAIMRDPDAKHENRLRAVELILDRGHGKPKQGMELTGEDGEPIKQAIRIAVSFHDPDDESGPIIDGAIDDGSIPEGV